MRAARTIFALSVGFVLGASAPSASADPPKATLTLHPTSASAAYAVDAPGPPPDTPLTLVDETGEHSATVTVTAADSPEACLQKNISRRHTGLGRGGWCLRVTGVPVGYKLTGTLSTVAVSIELTVERKDGLSKPIVVSVVALLLALLLSWLGSTWLPGRVDALLLAVATQSTKGIVDLKKWAADAQPMLSTADVLARVRWAKGVGKQQLVATRRRLRAQLDEHPEVGACPLRAACDVEAAEQTVHVSDVLTDRGERSTSAVDLLADWQRAVAARTEFGAILQRLLAASHDQATVTTLRTIERNGERLAENYLADFTLDRYVQQLGEFAAAAQAAHAMEPQRPSPRLDGHERFVGLGASGLRMPTLDAVRTTVRIIATEAALVASVALYAVTLMTVAVAGVLIASYYSNPTFGTTADYWTLAAAAFGSAQVTAIATAILATRGPARWTG